MEKCKRSLSHHNYQRMGSSFSRYKIQDVYLGTRSHPEWVLVKQKSAKQSAPKTHKICVYSNMIHWDWRRWDWDWLGITRIKTIFKAGHRIIIKHFLGGWVVDHGSVQTCALVRSRSLDKKNSGLNSWPWVHTDKQTGSVLAAWRLVYVHMYNTGEARSR